MSCLHGCVRHSLRSFSGSSTTAATVAATGVNSVAVVGAGQMGIGIAIVCAFVANRNVLVVDNNQESLNKGMKFVSNWLTKQEKQGNPTTTNMSMSDRITTSIDMNDISRAADCNFVIEAVSELESVKRDIFGRLDDICSTDTILVSNTSSIPISKISSFVRSDRQSLIAGMHFMNPVPVMQLIEIIPSLITSESTLTTIKDFATELKKEYSVSADSPGFIANRVLMPYINEAVFCVQEGIGTREDIDLTMKLGTNVPMGPLALADFIGIDTCLYIMETLHKQFSDSKYRPAPLLSRMVEIGWLGKKSGQGFYTYPAKK